MRRPMLAGGYRWADYKTARAAWSTGRDVLAQWRAVLCSPRRGHDDVVSHFGYILRVAIEEHLRHEPTKQSKSRIKKLCGFSRPQYRLRIGDDIRVFYDVSEAVVEVLAIVSKTNADIWLKRHGEGDEKDSSV